MNLTQWLAARQVTLGLDDARFADHLGISRAAWSYYKRGQRRPGLSVAEKAVATFPDERDEILRCVLPFPMGNHHVAVGKTTASLAAS